MAGIGESFRLEEPLPDYSKLLNTLIQEPSSVLGEEETLRKLDELKLRVLFSP